MPLREQDRVKLDGIVQQMEQNGEKPESIQFVVEDFKQKYGAVQNTQAPRYSTADKLARGAEKFASGVNAISGGENLGKALGALLGTRPKTDMPTGKQIAGSALQTGATIASLGLGAPATLAGRAASSAAIGATTAAGSKAQQQNSTTSDIAKSAVLGAGTGAALTGGMEKTLGVVKKGLGSSAENIYKRLIKTPIAQVRAGKEEIGSGLLKRGISGNYEEMARSLQDVSQRNNEALNQVIEQNATKSIDVSNVQKSLEKLKSQLDATPGESSGPVDAVLQAFKNKKTLSLAEAQELKRNLQSAVSTAFLRQTTSGATQAQKVAAQELRLSIEKAVPDVVPLNKEIEFGIRALKRLKETDAISPNKLRLMIEIVTGVAGLGISPLVTAGVVAERAASSPRISSKAAQLANKASKKSIDPKVNAEIERLLSAIAGRGAGSL